MAASRAQSHTETTTVSRARWYHTIELPGGIVTPGEYDLRPVRERVPLPASLAGRRCLDVGTRDGFWAFEMERRGGAVVGIDLNDVSKLDWPYPPPRIEEDVSSELRARDRAFSVAHAALGSNVEWQSLSVYDLSPDKVGEFDFAFLGTLLLHLRDPVGALAAIRRVLRGQLLVNEVVSLKLSLLGTKLPMAELMRLDEPFWWIPNKAALLREVEAAGYALEASGGPYLVPPGSGYAAAREPSFLPSRIFEQLARRLRMPHAWILARALP